ncbi:anaphase-promoting complex subunit 2 isoform X2 [Cryptomeria japonica]|uniref:anaphase-promoting complex subunit 2 isoform X2 n=1 Tax=Cryptomeria japonica TaxID=3369 RepID=UPI0025AD2927|nr:anaphase-promoting complex subunit 2 isoform X2 [Cryptomeria japonica]
MAVDMDISVPLENMDNNSIGDVARNWQAFCEVTKNVLHFEDMGSSRAVFIDSVKALISHGLGSLVEDYFLQALEEMYKETHALTFWRHFDEYIKLGVSQNNCQGSKLIDDWAEETLSKALEEICMAKCLQEKCLAVLQHTLQSCTESTFLRIPKVTGYGADILSRYQSMVSSVLLTTLPKHFSARLEEFTEAVEKKTDETNQRDSIEDNEMETIQNSSSGLIDEMEVDDANEPETCGEYGEVISKTWISKVGHIVHNLRELGFSSMTEDAYASAIFSLLKTKVHYLAREDHLTSVLEPIRKWIQAVPLQFLRIVLPYLCVPSNADKNGDPSARTSPLASCPLLWFNGRETASERITRWHLRLEYFAYETLQDLRIDQLFDIIIDYPESEDAIKDLKQCLDNTGQHAKLVESFLSALRYRLLIAGASTNDILEQYVSTIKALRTMDPTGVFLEAVGQPIGEYLRGRKDASKCIVAMLTDTTGGENSSGDVNEGISLLEELSRDTANRENGDSDDDYNAEDEKSWAAFERWEPDPVEADPSIGSRIRKPVDILGMLVGIFGSKEQLINEYCNMLAEKLLNKIDYDVERETRTLELFKILFGEGSMQRCEIMINDLTASKRTNANIKTTVKQRNQHEDQQNKLEEDKLSLDVVDATILSSCFWPTSQAESIIIPKEVDELLEYYANEFHVLKAPRKIIWKKNLGTVKLELQFEDRSAEYVVSPIHASIIMQFQKHPSWTAKNLAIAVGIPVDTLCRRISLWVNKGILVEAPGATNDEHTYTIVENIGEASHSDVDTRGVEAAFIGEEEGEASDEDQLQTKNLVVYEYFVKGMLTNFSSLKLEEIHKRLSDHSHGFYVYDLSLHQLQMFLSRLVSEDKFEVNDGEYRLRKQ